MGLECHFMEFFKRVQLVWILQYCACSALCTRRKLCRRGNYSVPAGATGNLFTAETMWT